MEPRIRAQGLDEAPQPLAQSRKHTVMLSPSSGCRRRPIVLLVLTAAAPRVKRAVHRQPVLEHFAVAPEVGRQPAR